MYGDSKDCLLLGGPEGKNACACRLQGSMYHRSKPKAGKVSLGMIGLHPRRGASQKQFTDDFDKDGSISRFRARGWVYEV